MATTSNMNMALPDPGDSGPTWAEKLNEALEGPVDGHDHTFGRGVPVPVAGLSIDAELPMNGHDLADARMAKFDNQTGTLAGLNDRRGLYVVAGDLYYNNGAGAAVRVTNGTGLSGASLGNIDGLPSTAYPNASLSWLDSFPGFALYQNTKVFARLRSGEIEVHESGAADPNAVTIKSPASLAADYALTLPPATPASDAFLTMNASGAMGTQVRAGGIGTTDLAALAVTEAKLASGAVTEAKIGALAVTEAKIGTLAVSTAKLADGAVTNAKIAQGVSKGLIAVGTVYESSNQPSYSVPSPAWTVVPSLVLPFGSNPQRATSIRLLASTGAAKVSGSSAQMRVARWCDGTTDYFYFGAVDGVFPPSSFSILIPPFSGPAPAFTSYTLECIYSGGGHMTLTNVKLQGYELA